MKPSVADIFPFTHPSDEQTRLLENIIRDYHRYDIFLINAPVAFGKSPIAKAIMNLSNHYGAGANWIVPTNELVRQGIADFDIPTLLTKKQYDSPAAFKEAKELLSSSPQAIMNYYTLLANRLYKPTLIIDESHSIISTLQDQRGVKYWETDKGFPENIHSTADIIVWLAKRSSWDMKAKKMLKMMEEHPDMYTMSYEVDSLRGKATQCLRLYPLSPRNNPPILWPPARTKKIFLMSATTSPTDLYELGLDDRRVVTYEGASSIPPERRPFILSCVGNMSGRGSTENMDALVSFIEDKIATHGGKGMIHATYGMAAKLRSRLSSHPRLMWHTKHNKARQFAKWTSSTDDAVLVGSGLTEGINLKGKLCEWQIITKVPFPYLGDPAVAAKRMQDEKWYVWQAVREVLQAYGRVCRGPTDRGVSYMVDSSFINVYNKNREMFPKWIREAIV